MKKPKGKLIVSSATLEGAQQLLNDYFYSHSYRIDPETFKVSNSMGDAPRFTVTTDRRRVRIYWD